MDIDPLPLALASLRIRITQVFPTQIRAAVATLDDEQLWWRPHEQANSVANLLLHLSGSLNHFLNRGIGGIPYERDRPQEFAARGSLNKAELLTTFDDMVAKAELTFAQIDVARLSAPSSEPSMHAIVLEDLINIAVHVATHMGQIVWIAKSFEKEGLRDLWSRTHEELGVWRRDRAMGASK